MRAIPYVLSVAFVLSTGCSTQVWYQPGKTAAQTYRDYTTCKAAATQTVDPHGIGNYALGSAILRGNAVGDLVNDCMRGKGYFPTKQSAVPDGPNYPKL
jgi:hypothetical protein